MDLAEEAFVLRRYGQTTRVAELTRRAYELESQAAELLKHNLSDEPTRSVLHRSAATLALEVGLIQEAERLIAQGLDGHAPPEIVDELLELREQIASLRRDG